MGARWRRAFLVVLAVVVAAGAAGLLGVRDASTDAADDGWTVRCTTPRPRGPGLDVPLNATVTHEGGLGKEVTLAVTGDYFDIYETRGSPPSRPRRAAMRTRST